MKTIDLVIPCYNEGEALKVMYKETKSVIDDIEKYQFKMIFIDDGSTDNTLEIIKSFAEEDTSIDYISFSRNFGKEAGMYAGLENSSGDYVAIIDADMQDPPQLLSDMIFYVDNGYDCCATRRVTRKGEPLIRSYFARKFYKLINKMVDIEIVDGARDFRLMTRQMVDAIISLGERERFSKGIFSWVGFKTKWIEYQNVERVAGETKWSFWTLFNYAVGGIASFTTFPLRITSIVGSFVSICTLVYLLFILIRTTIFGIDVPGYASIVAILLFSLGSTMLAMGIIGEYVAKTFIEVKRRPIYIVKSHNLTNTYSKGKQISSDERR